MWVESLDKNGSIVKSEARARPIAQEKSEHFQRN
jgi:hypothetical protein